MHSFAAPDRQTATRRSQTDGSTSDTAWRLNAVACALALAFAAMPAHAQENGGAIMISGPGETNPAAVVAMAKNAGMNVTAAPGAQQQPVAQPMGTPSPRGYARAVNGANAAMRAAALALDARADAADASSSAGDSSGMIVIPGNGEAKPAQPRLAMTPSQSTSQSTSPSAPQGLPASGMIEIPGNGEPSAHAAISNSAAAPRPIQKVAVSARDVTPVIVQADDAAKQDAVVPNRIATRGFQARPIAAAPAVPVTGGMMAVSMRPAAPIRTPLAPAAATPQGAQPSQDGDSIRAAALAFLQQEAAGLPGKADITVTPVFPRGLAPCSTLEPFMPPGARLWGRTTVGVRCTGERPWTLYLQARVSLQATYYLAARAMVPGEVLSAADLTARDGDITSMPQAIVTDPSQAIGAVTLSRIVAGLPLRTDMLRGASSIAIGSSVHVVTSGAGFSISAEGSAMNNAAPGQQVRVKTAGGQIITGIVKDSSTVEVQL
ncbi:hypothetical protein AX768_15255 [Burkholderia sp. PAMC 28687]|uniref:flagellar basal body P-ring formation chaperone FlgA n=1 Tax=Burkholderia sp. PAMC 28687 TaxID=1795874 RepID=UPI000782719A|nr:flagellar basal body P-ring formation chaperone FlgA [Burkholderia sp. PAMC 28687]AMM15255.1 hypothetical protein AX768_15255 [Burkholderia sp. PAMC 28687]